MSIDTEERCSVTPRKSLLERPWFFPVAVSLMVLALLGFLVWSTSKGITVPRPPEKPRQIEQYTILTPKGDIAVTEIRSGTEFNRILQLPDGQSIAEGGHVNSWGERQIDMIGNTHK